jgi:hypothetical protein
MRNTSLGNLSLCVCLFECKEQDQFNGLDTFHQLLKELTPNRASCVRLSLLIILLDWFAMEQNKSIVVKLTQIMQIIEGHNTSGKEMWIIISFLQSTNDGFKPQHGILLLQIF